MWAGAMNTIQSDSIELAKLVLHSLWMDSCECCLIELCLRIGCLCETRPMPSCSIYCTEALKSNGKGSRFTKEEGLADNSCSIQAGSSMSTVSSVFHAHLQDNVP